MHPIARPWFVGARAAVVGAIATLVGVVGHVRAGGDPPGLGQCWLLGLLWLLCVAVSAVFLIRQAGWLRLALLLLAEQVLVHTGLMTVAMSQRQSMPGMAGMPGMPGMPMTAMSPVPTPQMMAMHALAAVVVGLWLWRGECALARLIGLVWVALRLLWCPLAMPRPPRVTRALASRFDRLALWGERCAPQVRRRGPPAAWAS